jgi:hypothetical protein
MMRVPERYRLPIAILVSVALVGLVIGVVSLLADGRSSPMPPPTATPTPQLTPGVTAEPTGSPESAVRAFFDAVARARRTGDPTEVAPFVTSVTSAAYLTIEGFLGGQTAVGKASVLTRNEISDVLVEVLDGDAVVTFRHSVEGYDIDLETGEPLESPTALPDVIVRAEARLIDGRWLVERFEEVP